MRRYYLFLATLILLLAALLRFWQLHLYPPGPHYDEGAYLLITRSIAFGGARFFPIVEAYQGREVLYMYLNAPLLHLFGDRIYTLHLTSAFVNLLTIAASIRLAREMFRGQRGIVIALAVGISMTISFPQIFIARQAFRAVTLPLMQAAALLCLWRGLRVRRGWLWLTVGGLFAGGAVYTYMASRLFPVWLLIGGLALLWFDRVRWRVRLAQGVLFFGVLTVTAAPMALYAIQKPAIFWGRLGEVTQTDQAVSIGESVLLHARMFFIEGDPYLRYNVPLRPYFTPIEGVLLIVGLAAAAWRLVHARHPLERTGCLLALLSPLMTLPSIISVGGLPPSHMRSLGMVPLIFIMVGIGFEAAMTALARLRIWRIRPYQLAAAAAGVALITALAAAQTYFTWASRADLFYETDADLSLAARWLTQNHASGSEYVYLAARDRSHPTVMIEQTPPITWLGTNTLYRPPAGTTGLYVFPRSAPPPDDWRAWLESGRITDVPTGPDGHPAFDAFRLSGDTPLPIHDDDPPAAQNTFLRFVGLSAEPTASGARSEIISMWQIERTPDVNDLTPLLQLEDAGGGLLARSDIYMTDTDGWQPGAIIFVRLPVSVPPGTPPGRYTLRMAWVARASDRYLLYQQPDGAAGGIWHTIGEIEVTRPDSPPAVEALGLDAQSALDVAPGIRLVGYDQPPAALRPGSVLPLSLAWQATPLSQTRSELEISLLLTADGTELGLWQSPILFEQYSPARWQVGDIWRERLRIALPRTLDAGSYELVLQAGDQRQSLGVITIEGTARVFDPPPVARETDVVFGDLIRLYGYSIQTGDGDLTLELVWQSLRETDQDYTVFVHLVDVDGTILAQRDQMPLVNTYPTSLWRSGEFVTDVFQFGAVDINGLAFEIGLYIQASGVRLAVNQPGGSTASPDYVRICLPMDI